MSAFGTKRTYRVALHMSAIGGKADIAWQYLAQIRTGFRSNHRLWNGANELRPVLGRSLFLVR